MIVGKLEVSGILVGVVRVDVVYLNTFDSYDYYDEIIDVFLTHNESIY